MTPATLPPCYRCKSQPCVCADGITLYYADCRDILPLLEPGSVDLVLTDPPYGMNNDTDYTRFSGGHRDSIAKRGMGRNYGAPIVGDDMPFDPSPWMSFPAAILWGANHYWSRLPVGATLVWIKRNDDAFGSFLSDAELAWEKGGCGVFCRRDLSMNAHTRERQHPNQKPLGLMHWCLERHPSAPVILDPFCGSGTTLRAAKDLGRRCIGIEIEERYCEIAAQRLRQEVLLT